jgi:hypothetical protein
VSVAENAPPLAEDRGGFSTASYREAKVAFNRKSLMSLLE